MKFYAARAKLPSLANSLLAILSAILLVLAFPDFELWFLAFFAFVPLFYAVEREKESAIKSFVLGWIFGVWFFFGSCWWLTFAPVNYGGVPAPVAYFLLFGVTLFVGLFPALFAAAFSLVLKRFGFWGIISAPFLWTAIEFLRFYATGNNWNAIAYSQAFNGNINIEYASVGGIYLVGFICIFVNAYAACCIKIFCTYGIDLIKGRRFETKERTPKQKRFFGRAVLAFVSIVIFWQFIAPIFKSKPSQTSSQTSAGSIIVAVQPNVPMSNLRYEDRMRLQYRHAQIAEDALLAVNQQGAPHEKQKTIVVFPESPMNFEYARDREFQAFLKEFATRNNVSVLFNAAEPTAGGEGVYNSAVLIDERGAKLAQYDKIHLVPFGEYAPVPQPLASFVPTMVGNFEAGKSYDLMPFGAAKAGIMICFESHFPNLSREFAGQGADVLVELTNDGYLGNTPILRQHLANAVFRAVETNRPVLRVTNVGITAYIDENGTIYDETKPYTEDARVWTVKKSDASETFYVEYGDWFAWACSIASLILLILSAEILTQRHKGAKTQK